MTRVKVSGLVRRYFSAKTVLARVVTSKYNDDFLQWVGQQRFVNPDTKNRVLFVSLPEEEQQRIYARWQSMNQGEGAEETQRENQWLTSNKDPKRYSNIRFFHQDKNLDQDQLREKYSGTLDLAGLGGISSLIKEVKITERQREGKQILRVDAHGEHGLAIEREIAYEITIEEDKPHSIKNLVFAVERSAPPGVGTRMLASQVAAASEAGFPVIEATATRGSSNLNGYYTWPRLGFNAEMQEELFEKLKKEDPDLAKQVEELAERDPKRMWPDAPAELVHLMAIPEGREWWEKNGSTVRTKFPVSSDLDNAKSYHILREYTAAKAMAEGKTIPEYLSKIATKGKPKEDTRANAPVLTEQDNQILDQAWERLRQRFLSNSKEGV